MLGIRKEPVEFKIKKPVMGIDRNRYRDGILSTRKNSEIAMLSRLPDNHAEVIANCLPFEPEVPAPEVLEDLRWEEIRSRVETLGVYKVGMTKEECLLILRADRAALGSVCS